MKVFLVALSVVSLTLAAEVPVTPKGGLLIFPKSYPPTSTTTAAPPSDEKESLELLNDRVMARLREEVGSERGFYHVYLPDGRLQRVQYTAAPINSQQPQLVSGRSGSGQEPESVAPGFGSGLNAYYVQVPADRLQALRAYQPQQSDQFSQSAGASAKYSQSLEVDGQFVPLQVVTPEELAKYWKQ